MIAQRHRASTPPLMALNRSEQMARVRGADTRPEVALRSMLWRCGLRYRLGTRTPHGRPDLVFPSRRVAVFVDGCFWHGCPDHYTRPSSRGEFWAEKLATNTTRDRLQTHALEASSWRVVRAWEHEVHVAPDTVVADVRRALATDDICTPPLRFVVVRVDVLDPTARLERHHVVELRDLAPSYTRDQIRRTTKWSRGTA